MLNLRIIFIVVFVSFGVTGCGSTPSITQPLDEVKPIFNYSTSVFKWDQSKSTALNIANMGKPAELGFGLNDRKNPLEGVQSESSSKLGSFVSGFLAMDIGTGIATAFNESQRDDKIRYNPYIVSFIPKQSINLDDKIDTAKKVMSLIEQEFSVGLSKQREVDGGVVGIYSDSNPLNLLTSRLVMHGDICRKGTDFLAPSSNVGVKLNDRDMSSLLGINGKHLNYELRCSINFTSGIVGSIDDLYIVVHNVAASNLAWYTMLQVSESSKLAFIFPEYFNHFNASTYEKFTFKFPYTFVMFDGNKYLFDADEISSKDVLRQGTN
ncbi:hypothetical protein ACOI22_09660 [Glaciecola sp. 2405UD65-10]|uniref:hypothetical protein n=1 Tax=Glaciecola sp. 2405UD65-10 TaxID=3397244 RepID=UPI003B591E79